MDAHKSFGTVLRRGGAGGPVQIAYVKERLYVDYPKLEAILDRVAHHPVAVLSISGPMRTGKSFLLNYFVRYLAATPYEKASGKWWHRKLDAEFGWSDSSEVHTDGIFAWSEPLYVEQDGETVAVLLLDVQGCFDSKTTTRESALLFAFCSVLSSTIVCNVSTQLSEDSLHSLLLFAETAEQMIGSDGTGSGVKGTGSDGGAISDPCKLVFAVRDWQSPQSYPYGYYEYTGAATKNFVHDKLRIDDDLSEEARLLRRKLFRHFRDVDCCLMPYPGDQLACHNVSFGLSGPFADTVRDFVQRLLRPRNVVVKTVEHREVKGYRLKYHVQKWLPRFGTNAAIPPSCKAYMTVPSPRTTLDRKFRSGGAAGAKKGRSGGDQLKSVPKRETFVVDRGATKGIDETDRHGHHHSRESSRSSRDSRRSSDSGSDCGGDSKRVVAVATSKEVDISTPSKDVDVKSTKICVEISTEEQNRRAFQVALTLYRTEVVRGLIQDWSMLQTWHDNAKKEAMVAFEVAPRCSIDVWMEHYQRALSTAIDEQFSKYQKEFAVKRPVVDSGRPLTTEKILTGTVTQELKEPGPKPSHAHKVGGAAAPEEEGLQQLKGEVAKVAKAMGDIANALSSAKNNQNVERVQETVVQSGCPRSSVTGTGAPCPQKTEKKPVDVSSKGGSAVAAGGGIGVGDGSLKPKADNVPRKMTNGTQTSGAPPQWQHWTDFGLIESDPSVDYLNQALQSEYDTYQWRRREMDSMKEAITASVVRALGETVTEQLQSVTSSLMSSVQKTTTDCTSDAFEDFLDHLHRDLAVVDQKLHEDLHESHTRVSRISDDITTCKELVEKLQNQDATLYVCNFSSQKTNNEESDS